MSTHPALTLPSFIPNITDMLPAMPTLPFMGATTSQTITQAATASLHFGSQATQFAVAAGLALAIMMAGWALARWLMARTHKALSKAKVSDTAAQFIASSLRFVVLLTAFIIAIVQLGVPTGTLTAVLGALALALGLGLKDTLNNVAAGIMLLVNRPFETGDIIQLNTFRGTVKRINLFQTELNTSDNIRIFMPNLTIWNNAVQNFTHNRVRMVEVAVGFGYNHTTAQCRAAIETAISADPLILKEPHPFIGLDMMNDVAMHYIVRVWVKTPDWAKVRYTLLERIKTEAEHRNFTLFKYPLAGQPPTVTTPPPTRKPKKPLPKRRRA